MTDLGVCGIIELDEHSGDFDMGKVIGFGGLFFKCRDPDKTKAFYKLLTEQDQNAYGGWDFVHSDTAKIFPVGARTVFAPFDEASDYFAPSELPFMFNLIVDDLDGVLARLAENGIAQTQDRESYDYGDFAWIMDPDGRKVELWQPKETTSE